MIVSPQIYEKLCSEYRKAVDKLENGLNNACDNKEKHELFKEFYQNRFMVKDLWNLRAQFKWFSSLEEDTLGDAAFHFYYDRRCEDYLDHPKLFYSFETLTKLLNDEAKTLLLKKDDRLLFRAKQSVSYPHINLQRDFMDYVSCCSSLPAPQLKSKVKSMIDLADKIKKSEDDIPMWISYLRESNDGVFIRHTIQDRIASNPMNKGLWKLYITYLEEINPKKMLQSYSRYCRLFLDDEEMKNKYQNAVEKYGSDVNYWDNLFDFEEEAAEYHGKRMIVKKKIEKSTFALQSSSMRLPPSLLYYIMSAADLLIKYKLHKCSKSMFAKYPYPICHRLLGREHWDDHSMSFFEDSVKVFDYPWLKPSSGFRKIHLATWLNFMGHEKFDKLSQVIENYIFKCDATYIHIICQNITENEFDFLVGHGNVHSLDLYDTKITKVDGSLLSVSEVIKKVPKVQRFEYSGPFTDFSELQFKSKLHHFVLHEPFETPIDTVVFYDFLTKYAFPCSYFTINIYGQGQDYIRNFRQHTSIFLDSWKPHNEVPKVQVLDWSEDN